MNFLALCQRAAREAGVSGTGPSAVTSQTGELGRIVNWVGDAWRTIQTRHDQWKWMRSQFSLETVAADDTYAYGDADDTLAVATISRFARWHADDPEHPLRCYLQSSGVAAEYFLIYLPWADFRRIYKFGSAPASERPVHVTVDPQNNLLLGPAPNDVFVVRGDYQRGPLELAANGDTPDMPDRFHMAIVWEAVKSYAAWDEAASIYGTSEKEFKRVMRALEADQLPEWTMAGPLA